LVIAKKYYVDSGGKAALGVGKRRVDQGGEAAPPWRKGNLQRGPELGTLLGTGKLTGRNRKKKRGTTTQEREGEERAVLRRKDDGGKKVGGTAFEGKNHPKEIKEEGVLAVSEEQQRGNLIYQKLQELLWRGER